MHTFKIIFKSFNFVGLAKRGRTSVGRPPKQPRLDDDVEVKEKEEAETTEPEPETIAEGDVDTDNELTELDAEVILRDLGSRGKFC